VKLMLRSSESSSRHKWFGLLVVLMAPFMAYVDFYIVFVANPSIQHGLHASFEQIQFVFAGYIIAYGVNLVTAGRLGDTYGRKRMFMIGMACFTITSALCAFAQEPLTLIITRVFQGTSAALMFPQALSIIQATFTSKQKDKAIALYGATIGMGAAAGQFLGGFLIQTNLFNLDWRLIFLVNVPIGIGTLIAALFIVHESKSEKPIRLDIGGAAILSAILFLLLYPLIEGRNAGWPLWMYVSIIASITLIFPFIFFESSVIKRNNNNRNGNGPHSTYKLPLIPVSLFKDRSFIIGTLILIVFYIGNPSFIFVLTFYLQNGLGFSSLVSGLTFLPMGTGIIISSLLAPKIGRKLEAGILKIGLIVIIIGYALFIITAHQESNTGLQWSQLLLYMFIVGIGLNFVLVPLINIILSRAKIEDAGAASGVLNTMIAVGNAMGIAIIASIFSGLVGTSSNHIGIHHYTDAFVNSTFYNIGLVIAALVLVFFLASSRAKRTREHDQHSDVVHHCSV
jgi:EmrB/QacA subfamily drug resistance transporter